jgi:L-alanine-DL-glutamate epimerase-like enolase superfamily enzyme
MTITPPPSPIDHPDRFLDAQEAIEAAVLQLIDEARSVGWGEFETIAAVIAVSENRMLSICENERVNRQIEELRRRGQE